MKLTEKQKRFCDYYIETGNGTQSAIRAGYSKKTAKEMATENLSKPHLSEYINKRLKEIEQSRIASAQEVLETLTFFARDTEGKASDRIKATELLGKRYALFTEKHEVNASVEHKVNPLKEKSSDELLEIAKGLFANE